MVILLIGLSIAVGFPLSIFSEALAGGLYRFDLFNTVSILMALLLSALTILLLEMGYGLIDVRYAAASSIPLTEWIPPFAELFKGIIEIALDGIEIDRPRVPGIQPYDPPPDLYKTMDRNQRHSLARLEVEHRQQMLQVQLDAYKDLSKILKQRSRFR